MLVSQVIQGRWLSSDDVELIRRLIATHPHWSRNRLSIAVLLTFYVVARSRGRELLSDILGKDFGGVLVSDCLAIYDDTTALQQKCYAHHLKAIRQAKALHPHQGEGFLCEVAAMLRAAVALQQQKADLSLEIFSDLRQALEHKAVELLEPPRSEPNEEAVRKRLNKQRDHLFTFLDHDGVDATNNLAERQLRPAVIARKISCGNKTQKGARTWQILASLAATCAQRATSFIWRILSVGNPRNGGRAMARIAVDDDFCHYCETGTCAVKRIVKFSITHSTTYTYALPVRLTPHVFRLRPRCDGALWLSHFEILHIGKFAQEIVNEAGGHTLDFLGGLNRRLHETCLHIIRETGMPQAPGVTLRRRRGSCRDLAVLFIDACRAVGIAARFVSGYRRYGRDPAKRYLHAWPEVFLPGGGWRGYDPADGDPVADLHVVVAASREAAGAAPIQGAYFGESLPSTKHVRVQIGDSPAPIV